MVVLNSSVSFQLSFNVVVFSQEMKMTDLQVMGVKGQQEVKRLSNHQLLQSKSD